MSKKTNKPIQVQPTYAFPTRSRCPRCESTDTIALSTQDKWQYRKCQVPVCRKRYTVEGKPI